MNLLLQLTVLIILLISSETLINGYRSSLSWKICKYHRKHVSLSESKKSEFVDLFAVGDKKSTTSTSTSSTQTSVMDESRIRRKINVESQAELLRLEAEKEQIEMELISIESEKARLIEIDEVIDQFINGISVQTILATRRQIVTKALFFRMIELANNALDESTKQKYLDICENFMGSLKEQDEPLHTEITADVRKDMQSEYNRSKPKKMDVLLTPGVTTGEKFEQVLEQWVKQTMEGSNITKLTLDNVASPDDIGGPDNIEIIEGDRFNPFSNATILPDFGAMVRFPTFLPIIVLPMMMRSTEITPAEVKIITENIFTADILTNVTVESMGLSVTIRGIPAEGKTLKEVYDIALKRVSLFPGLKDRVRLFMLPDYMNPNEVAMSPFSPNGRTSSSRMKTSEKYSTNKFEPVFLLLSRSAKPRELGNVEYATALLSFLATCITSLIYSVDLNSFNNGFMQQVQEADPEIISKAFFIAGGLIIVQLFHEIGHYLAAFFHKTKLSIPWFIPSLQIGYFGSIVNFLDFPKTRKELFDISISGPLLGFIVSLACTVIGLELTQSATTDVAATFPSIPTGFLTSSLFIYELVDSFLHVSNTIVNANNIIDPQAATAIHPLVAIGIAGLLANAFNCLPIGRLDGGRVAMSIFGRKSAQTINFFALLSQALSLFFNSSPLTFFWSLYVFFLQRGQDIPPEDDVSPIASSEDDEKKGTLWAGRLASLIFCALLASAILLPLPKELITSAANQPLNIDNFIGTSI